ncbi:dTDP-glucose 4,6-dehydratase [Brevundimonas sp. 2R-24]|uniref:dTDP-glucose 4,6-dehydratase n=1 Tax=Peiella sedimenti TaxID=3061083 RepID=A0ABT8SN03_9CAUL|nr:dTDP-glucose 4,6-dehydratase [Caulobacteraceae bacterium XZ-24]
MTTLVTGGCGFIGSALVRRLVGEGRRVVTLDALTYAGSLERIAEVEATGLHVFEHVDLADGPAVRDVLERHRPKLVFHLAAESHVDRSIDGPMAFVRANLLGTANLLEAWRSIGANGRFVHVSTDEVFGALGETGAFDETTPYDPRSPYSATKAGSDHLARAWAHTYGLDVVVTNCSNNYGPWQHAEKLIPTLALNARHSRPLPIYGAGGNVRDWLHVEDHVDGLIAAAEKGRTGAAYLFGGRNEKTTLEVANGVCAVMDRLRPEGAPHDRLITLVADRPGHDFRYAIDPSLAERELGWTARRPWSEGLAETVAWYLERDGLAPGERLGLGDG